MSRDVPDEGGSKGPEERQEGMKVKNLWIARNLETGESHLLEDEDRVSSDTGKVSKFLRIIGRTGGKN